MRKALLSKVIILSIVVYISLTNIELSAKRPKIIKQPLSLHSIKANGFVVKCSRSHPLGMTNFAVVVLFLTN